jgi:hypothetical protein
MESLREGQLVTIADESGKVLEGIVFQAASHLKVVVAVPDKRRGAVFRTFHPRTLTERETPGADDEALSRLIRRTPATARGGPRAGSGAGQGLRGVTRSRPHRSNG